jgi:hypothetical protein
VVSHKSSNPLIDVLANRFGIRADLVQQYLDGDTISPHTETDRTGMAALVDAIHEATREESDGIHVHYIDAEVFADHHLAAIKCTLRYPAIRLVLHAESDTQPFTASMVLAKLGASALDLCRLEGATCDAVARVVLTKARNTNRQSR